MRVRWTPEAASDLARIVERIRGENSEAAHRVAQTIYNGTDAAAEFSAPWAHRISAGHKGTGVRSLAIYCRARNRRKPGSDFAYSALLPGLAVSQIIFSPSRHGSLVYET